MKDFISVTDPELVKMINNGLVGVIPTDTIYGLVGLASSESAISRMYGLKERERQPGTIIASSVQQLEVLGFPQADLQLMTKFWPGPISVVLSANGVANYLKDGLDSLPVRIPDYPELLDLLSQTGPLMTTSANPPSAPSATNIEQAKSYFGESVDFYVDSGDLSGREPSTIIGFDETGEIQIFREGAINSEALQNISRQGQ